MILVWEYGYTIVCLIFGFVHMVCAGGGTRRVQVLRMVGMGSRVVITAF